MQPTTLTTQFLYFYSGRHSTTSLPLHIHTIRPFVFNVFFYILFSACLSVYFFFLVLCTMTSCSLVGGHKGVGGCPKYFYFLIPND